MDFKAFRICYRNKEAIKPLIKISILSCSTTHYVTRVTISDGLELFGICRFNCGFLCSCIFNCTETHFVRRISWSFHHICFAGNVVKLCFKRSSLITFVIAVQNSGCCGISDHVNHKRSGYVCIRIRNIYGVG